MAVGSLFDLPPKVQDRIMPEPMSGCWLWIGHTNGGYGRYQPHDAISVYAHRMVYEILIGAVSPDLDLDHLCRTKACVNPAHLEPVTHAVNISRGAWLQKTRRPEGHPYSHTVKYEHQGKTYYTRRCRTCIRAKANARNHRRRVQIKG